MRKSILAIIAYVIFFDFIFPQAQPGKQIAPKTTTPVQPVNPASAKPANPAGPKIDEKGGKKSDEKQASDIALDLRLMGGLGVPLGSISTLGAGVGGGGQFDIELKLPFSLGPLNLKLGLGGGFYGLGLQSGLTSLDVSITLVPVLGYIVLAYPIKKINLTPYISIGGGGNISSYSIAGTTQASSTFDGMMGFRLGAEYSLPTLPKLSLTLNASYLLIFEQDLNGQPNNGQLITIEAGVSYRIVGN